MAVSTRSTKYSEADESPLIKPEEATKVTTRVTKVTKPKSKQVTTTTDTKTKRKTRSNKGPKKSKARTTNKKASSSKKNNKKKNNSNDNLIVTREEMLAALRPLVGARGWKCYQINVLTLIDHYENTGEGEWLLIPKREHVKYLLAGF